MKSLFQKNIKIGEIYKEENNVTLFGGDCIDLLKQVPNDSAQLVITSPPYNIGKEYEKRQKLQSYLDFQEKVIRECYRVLKPNGSICWQTGNYVEKTEHPCQFPIALIERLVLSMTKENDLVLDPFIGAGTTAVAALLHNRKSAGADIEKKYLNIAKKRIELLSNYELKTRPMNQPIYEPDTDSQSNIFIKLDIGACLWTSHYETALHK